MIDWQAVEIAAGTPPGGGLDRVARALAAALQESESLPAPVTVLNIPGDGARKVWGHLDKRPGNPHLLSISSPNLTTDRLVGIASFDHGDYTPLATLCTEYIAFAVRADSPLRSAGDLLARLKENAGGVTVALSTAAGNPNHMAFAKAIRHVGADVRAPKVRVFDTALDAVADAVNGPADVAAVTAASVLKELSAGRARVLAISAPERLAGPLRDAPTWREQGVDCVIGAWRGASGPAGLNADACATWQQAFRRAMKTSAWTAALAQYAWTAFYRDGAELTTYLANERREMAETLEQLGLLKA